MFWFFVGPFVYFHTSYVRTAKALARLRGCAGSPKPSLIAYMISTKISWTSSIHAWSCLVERKKKRKQNPGPNAWQLIYSHVDHDGVKYWPILSDSIHMQKCSSLPAGYICVSATSWLLCRGSYIHDCPSTIEFIKQVGGYIMRGFELNKFNNVGAQIQNSTYHMTPKSHLIRDFSTNTSRFRH